MHSSEIDLLLEVLEQAPHGLSRPELLSQLRQRVPHLQPADVERVLQVARHRLRIDGNRIFAAAPRVEEAALQRRLTSRRFVAFDLESIVRPIVKEPYREQHIFQIGGVRFGPDEQWCGEQREFSAFASLPSEYELLIYRDELRERYLAAKRPLFEVLEEFRAFCASADTVVAYNGVGHDFRLIDEEYIRCGLEPLLKGARAPHLVDGLYLAQALWPIPPRQHRLGELLKRLEIDVEEMQWHDALDDSKMVVELLEYGAREFLPTLGSDLVDLLAVASTGSDAWDLLFTVAGRADRHGGPFDHAETSQIVLRALEATTKQPVRPESPSQVDGGTDLTRQTPMGPISLKVPDELRASDGRVSLEKLLLAVKGEGAEVREAQHLMVARLREWLIQGAPALVEAPTGTGKSYALLAAALDWLDADDQHKVVIATYTKQLQSQLATDIEALTEHAIPELARATDMVKGSANRLSLRALMLALSELTEPDQRQHRRGRHDFSDDQHYRDLVIYLVLRFVAEGKPTEEWEARSVDRVDVPPFFDEYCPRRLTLYLATLSQAESEDYRADRGGIGRYTQNVREALESRRLVVANHALLLAHLDDFDGIGEQTLLFVDEAHELEGAATGALSPELDSSALAELATQVAEWAQDQIGLPGVDQLADAVRNLDRYLDDERLARAAMVAFDTAQRDPFGRAALRTVTVASPLQGDAFVRPMLHLAAELRTCRYIVGLISQAFRRVAQNPPADPYELDRFHWLFSRTADIDKALVAIVRDVDAVLAPPEGSAPTGSDEAAAAAAEAHASAADAADQTSFEEFDEGVEDGAPVGDQVVALEAMEEAELLDDGEDARAGSTTTAIY